MITIMNKGDSMIVLKILIGIPLLFLCGVGAIAFSLIGLLIPRYHTECKHWLVD